MAATILLLFVAFVAAAAMVGSLDQPRPAVVTQGAPPTHKIKTAARPAAERTVLEDLGKPYCIGGTLCPDYCEQQAKRCEVKASYSVTLDAPARLSRIELHAEDEVGLTRAAELVVKLDGRQLATVPVLWSGSILNVPVNRRGQSITIESRDPRGLRFAGEEAVISDVRIFGVGLK